MSFYKLISELSEKKIKYRDLMNTHSDSLDKKAVRDFVKNAQYIGLLKKNKKSIIKPTEILRHGLIFIDDDGENAFIDYNGDNTIYKVDMGYSPYVISGVWCYGLVNKDGKFVVLAQKNIESSLVCKAQVAKGDVYITTDGVNYIPVKLDIKQEQMNDSNKIASSWLIGRLCERSLFEESTGEICYFTVEKIIPYGKADAIYQDNIRLQGIGVYCVDESKLDEEALALALEKSNEFKYQDEQVDGGFISIDPESTNSIDDAIKLTKNADGTYRLEVAITHVTDTVTKDTLVEQKAKEKFWTVHSNKNSKLLPVLLSTHIHSLLPQTVHQAIVGVFDLTPDFDITSYDFVIKPIKTEVAIKHNGTKTSAIAELNMLNKEGYLNPVIDMFNELFQNHYKLKEKPFCASLRSFEERNLVEDEMVAFVSTYMLLVNTYAAKYLQEKNSPCIYFNHHAITKRSDEYSLDWQGDESNNKEDEDYPYAHFSSPLRRYPDVITHRLMVDAINGCVGESYTKQELEELVVYFKFKRKQLSLAKKTLKSNLYFY
jgi:exoribonuclease R